MASEGHQPVKVRRILRLRLPKTDKAAVAPTIQSQPLGGHGQQPDQQQQQQQQQQGHKRHEPAQQQGQHDSPSVLRDGHAIAPTPRPAPKRIKLVAAAGRATTARAGAGAGASTGALPKLTSSKGTTSNPHTTTSSPNQQQQQQHGQEHREPSQQEQQHGGASALLDGVSGTSTLAPAAKRIKLRAAAGRLGAATLPHKVNDSSLVASNPHSNAASTPEQRSRKLKVKMPGSHRRTQQQQQQQQAAPTVARGDGGGKSSGHACRSPRSPPHSTKPGHAAPANKSSGTSATTRWPAAGSGGSSGGEVGAASADISGPAGGAGAAALKSGRTMVPADPAAYSHEYVWSCYFGVPPPPAAAAAAAAAHASAGWQMHPSPFAAAATAATTVG